MLLAVVAIACAVGYMLRRNPRRMVMTGITSIALAVACDVVGALTGNFLLFYLGGAAGVLACTLLGWRAVVALWTMCRRRRPAR